MTTRKRTLEQVGEAEVKVKVKKEAKVGDHPRTMVHKGTMMASRSVYCR